MGLNIEKAFCLCIDKRQEYWEDLENQCILKGIPFEKFVTGNGKILPQHMYDYIDDPDPKIDTWTYGHPDNGTWVNHYNAFISHQRIIQRAKDQRLENLLMLEDDAYFTDRYNFVLSSIDHHFEGNEPLQWDMIYFGWWIGHEDDEWNQEIETTFTDKKFTALARVFTNTGGLHGVLINNTIYDLLLRLNPIAPIDMQLNTLYHQGPRSIKSWVVIPKIIHDKGLFSECEQNESPRSII